MADAPGGSAGLHANARTYRLVPNSQCARGGLTPDLQSRVGLFSASLDDLKALDAEWEARPAGSVCLVGTSAFGRHDLLVRTGVDRNPTHPGRMR